MAAVDVVGSSPISFTNSKGAQKVVPLSALSFNGSSLQLKSAWASLFDAAETTTLLALATARAAVGELTPPPSPPPVPALAVRATHAGPETNGITVTVSSETGKPPLITKITMTVAETDAWSALGSGDAAAQAVGVDAPTGKPGDPLAGTGLIVVQQGSTGASTKIPVASSGVLKAATPVDLLDADSKKVCTIAPRTDYAGTGGLSYAVTVDASGKTFTITATYDSTKEVGTQNPITVQTLASLPAPVGYLVAVNAPPSGAMVPVDGPTALSGGSAGIAANGLLYT